MADVIEPIVRLSDMFRRLDGVGQKSAMSLTGSAGANFSSGGSRGESIPCLL